MRACSLQPWPWMERVFAMRRLRITAVTIKKSGFSLNRGLPPGPDRGQSSLPIESSCLYLRFGAFLAGGGAGGEGRAPPTCAISGNGPKIALSLGPEIASLGPWRKDISKKLAWTMVRAATGVRAGWPNDAKASCRHIRNRPSSPVGDLGGPVDTTDRPTPQTASNLLRNKCLFVVYSCNRKHFVYSFSLEVLNR